MKVVIKPENPLMKTTQRQFELEVAQVLEYGDIQAISNLSGIGYKYLDSQLSPNDDRRGYLYGALMIICALDEFSPERGERVWQILSKARELSKSPGKTQSVRDELVKTNKEMADVVEARLDEKPLYEQLTEVVELVEQAGKLKAAILNKINAEKDSFDKPQTRIRRVA